jgi:hypothetical protein
MFWKREKFTIATADPNRKATVSGCSSNGLGIHRFSAKRDSLGRQRWSVTHLYPGSSFCM